MRPRAAAFFYFSTILLAGMATGVMLALLLVKFLSGSVLAAMGDACGGIFQAGHGFLAAGRLNYFLAVVAAAAFFSQGAFFLGGGTRLLRATNRHLKTHSRAGICCPALPVLSQKSWARHVFLLPGEGMDAQTVGILRPRILISRGLARLLATDELKAVLAHEEAHRAGRDNLLVMIARAVSLTLFYLPGQKLALREMCRNLERAADRKAAQLAGGPIQVASSLAKIVSLSGQRQGTTVVASAAAGAGIADVTSRIEELINEGPDSRLRPWRPFLFAAISVAAFMAFASSAYAVTGADQRGAFICFTEHAQEVPPGGVCVIDHPNH